MKRHPKRKPLLSARALWQRGGTVHADVDAVLAAAVEEVIFNIPADLAFQLRFGGQVRPECLKTVGDRRDRVGP